MNKLIIPVMALLITISACKKTEDQPAQMPRKTLPYNFKVLETSYTNGDGASVVFINGFNNDFGSWQKVYQQLNTGNTIFTYNRPGTGRSASTTGVRDAQAIANEMYAVLAHQHVQPPFVLVAHDMGAAYARMFHQQYPHLVKGLVLVDAAHEKFTEQYISTLPNEAQNEFKLNMEKQFQDTLNKLPDGALKEEYRANYKANFDLLKNCAPLNKKPVYVISSSQVDELYTPGAVNIKLKLHEELAKAAGDRGVFVTTPTHGDVIQQNEPALIVNAIKWVLSK